MEAAEQNVARYAALEGFKRVVAPFDGVVTARLTDVGSYLNAEGANVSVRGTATELFTVADVHAMRVFVSVPQDYAHLLGPGSRRRCMSHRNPENRFRPGSYPTNHHGQPLQLLPKRNGGNSYSSGAISPGLRSLSMDEMAGPVWVGGKSNLRSLTEHPRSRGKARKTAITPNDCSVPMTDVEIRVDGRLSGGWSLLSASEMYSSNSA